MSDSTIAFIGSGNMATSLIGGLIANGYDATKIWASSPELDKLEELKEKFKINVTQDNKVAADSAQIIVLAVKPQVVNAVAIELAQIVSQKKACVISIAAGIRTDSLTSLLGQNTPIVRCMPNTPALVQTGATAVFANPFVSVTQKSFAESIMRAVGVVVWLDDENDMDIVTAVSGSGPAYFFLLMECLEQAATKLGLDKANANLLIMQTALGAARMALESNIDVASLRQQVTSKGGTTEAALRVFEQAKFPELVLEAVKAATNRSAELSQLT